MKKNDQIILTPKSKREFYIMLTFVVYLEPLVREKIKKHKKLSIFTIWQKFPEELKKRGLNPEF
jgi:hypothetical protein